MENIKLSIIMPVYNEINTFLKIYEEVQKEKHYKEIVIVDDCSKDGTREILQEIKDNNVKIILNSKNRGKGYCIRQAIENVTGDIVIIQDADLEYYPDEYSILIERIVGGKADVVYGSRFTGTHRVFLFYHYVGNTVLNFIANITLNTTLTDLMTCYKAFTLSAIKSLCLKANRFGIEPEITAEVFKRQYRVYEVPISYNGRPYEEGKKIKWTDFFSCLYWLIKPLFRSADVGEDTLLRMRIMKNNNSWTYKMIEPYLGDKVLELGSGMGTISRYLIKRGRKLFLTDINKRYIEILENKFGANPNVTIVNMDIADINIRLKPEKFDTVVGINVLEHIEDDVSVIKKLKNILSEGAKIVLLVPAHRALFGKFDKGLNHYRRYEKQELQDKLIKEGFVVETIEFMNRLGAIGWFINFKILKRKRMPSVSTVLFDKCIPLLSVSEKHLKLPFGLSLFCVAVLKTDG